MVAGLLCPSCGKFTSLEELKGQKWPEWDEYVARATPILSQGNSLRERR